MFIIDDIIWVAIAAGAVAGGIVIYEHWDEIKKWLKEWFTKTLDLIEKALKAIWHGTSVALNIASDGLAEIVQTVFYREEGELKARTQVVKIHPSKLPPPIKAAYDRAKLEGKAMDITPEAKMALELAF